MYKKKRIIRQAVLILLLATVAFFSIAKGTQSPPVGSISGKVVNAYGEPVADARVEVDRFDVIMMQWPWADTNANGEFVIEGLSPGPYRVHAAKAADGYGPTHIKFQADDLSFEPRVSVTANEVTRDVIVGLGRKGAWLKGRVISASTNEPITTAQITLRRMYDPDKFIRTGVNRQSKGDSSFEILAPTVPFT